MRKSGNDFFSKTLIPGSSNQPMNRKKKVEGEKGHPSSPVCVSERNKWNEMLWDLLTFMGGGESMSWDQGDKVILKTSRSHERTVCGFGGKQPCLYASISVDAFVRCCFRFDGEESLMAVIKWTKVIIRASVTIKKKIKNLQLLTKKKNKKWSPSSKSPRWFPIRL